MAEILISEESIDSALKRFKKAVEREGVLKVIKQGHFNGAMTKSQRRRAKKMLAKNRYRKNHRCDNSLSGPDKDKIELQDSPLYHDTDWATGNETWNPDLTPIKRLKVSEEDQNLPWRKNFVKNPLDPLFMFGEDKRLRFKPEESNIPSVHVCVIAVYRWRGDLRYPIVRGLNDDGSERHNFQFPGGGMEKGETPEKAGVREYTEETGLKIADLGIKDRIASQILGNHTFICFLSKVIGGRLRKGAEIVELRLVTFDQLYQMAEAGVLSPKHDQAFQVFKAMIEVVQNRDQKKEVANV